MKKLYLILAASVLFSGCSTLQKVNKLEAGKVNLVCIAEHKEVRENVLEVIQEGLTNHGVKFRVIPGSYQIKNNLWIPTVQPDQVAGCDAVLFYVANWNWDITMYMKFANLWMTTPDIKQRLGDASYDARASLNKFINARAKILELVDGLFEQYKNTGQPNVSKVEPVQNSIAKSPAPEVKKIEGTSTRPTSDKLRELQDLRKEGLISEEDYQKKKRQLIDQL
jgi:hypothetical protein